MKKIFIIANWKSNKTTEESIQWLQEISKFQFPTSKEKEKEIIVCPPFTLLPNMKEFISEAKMPIKLGSQYISKFSEGAFTGEISAKQASEFITHSIVGHSERRKYFHETSEDVLEQISRLVEVGITPILCISDMQQLDYYLMNGKVVTENAEEIIFVYEPPNAISGGGAFRPEDPDTANKGAAGISTKVGKRVITLYGGSVNPDNAAELFSKEYIDGSLVGQASLSSGKFMQIIENA